MTTVSIQQLIHGAVSVMVVTTLARTTITTLGAESLGAGFGFGNPRDPKRTPRRSSNPEPEKKRTPYWKLSPEELVIKIVRTKEFVESRSERGANLRELIKEEMIKHKLTLIPAAVQETKRKYPRLYNQIKVLNTIEKDLAFAEVYLINLRKEYKIKTGKDYEPEVRHPRPITKKPPMRYRYK